MEIPLTTVTHLRPESLLFVGSFGHITGFDCSALPTSPLRKIWQNPLPGAMYTLPSQVFDGQQLYVGVNSLLFAINPFNGDTIWKISAPFGTLISLCLSPYSVIIGGQGYVGCYFKNGAQAWLTNLKGTGYNITTLMTVNDRIIAGSAGHVFGLDVQTGAILWRNDLPGKYYGPVSLAFNPTCNHVLVSTCSSVSSIDLFTGLTVEEFTYPDKFSHTLTSLFWENVHYGGCYGELFATNIKSKEVLWKNPLSGCGYTRTSSLAFTPLGLVIALNGYVNMVDIKTGATIWQTSLPTFSKIGCSILYFCNTLMVGCFGTLYSLDPATGKILFEDDLKGMGYTYISLGSIVGSTEENSTNLMFEIYSNRNKRC